MSIASSGAPRETPGAKSKGARAAKATERKTIRAIEEATAVGCGLSLRREMIAEAAYYRAERRGFESGHALEDWVAAEGEIQDLWTRALEEGPLRCGN